MFGNKKFLDRIDEQLESIKMMHCALVDFIEQQSKVIDKQHEAIKNLLADHAVIDTRVADYQRSCTEFINQLSSLLTDTINNHR